MDINLRKITGNEAQGRSHIRMSRQLQTVLRIEALSEAEVFQELKNIMDGKSFSWHKIDQIIRAKVDNGTLRYTGKDGEAPSEWTYLCQEKYHWDRKGRLSMNSPNFFKDCLINLSILPMEAGMSDAGKPFCPTLSYNRQFISIYRIIFHDRE